MLLVISCHWAVNSFTFFSSVCLTFLFRKSKNQIKGTCCRTIMTHPLMWIEAEELAPIIHKQPHSVMIVDLRDDDYEVGHIVNSVNVPSESLGKQSAMQQLLDRAVSNDQLEYVVFHCYYSQVRGPTFGQKFHNLLQEKYPDNDRLQCKVLRGGWGYWYKRWRTEDDVHRYITYLPKGEDSSCE